MSETTPFTLETPTALLHGLVDLPDAPGERPTVVICHGFKGFMEVGFFPSLAALLAERGFVAVRFNLSGTGMRPGDERVTDLAAFRDNTYSRELADLTAVLDATAGGAIAPGRVDRGRIGLFGHSRGGGIALLAAASPAWRDRLRALVTWAAIADTDRFTPEQKEEWRRDGEFPVVNVRTGQQLAMGLGMLADIEERRAELDLPAAAAARRAPWLIVHGAEDETVSVDAAHLLAERAASPAELLLVPGGEPHLRRPPPLHRPHPAAHPGPQRHPALVPRTSLNRRSVLSFRFPRSRKRSSSFFLVPKFCPPATLLDEGLMQFRSWMGRNDMADDHFSRETLERFLPLGALPGGDP